MLSVVEVEVDTEAPGEGLKETAVPEMGTPEPSVTVTVSGIVRAAPGEPVWLSPSDLRIWGLASASDRTVYVPIAVAVDAVSVALMVTTPAAVPGAT